MGEGGREKRVCLNIFIGQEMTCVGWGRGVDGGKICELLVPASWCEGGHKKGNPFPASELYRQGMGGGLTHGKKSSGWERSMETTQTIGLEGRYVKSPETKWRRNRGTPTVRQRIGVSTSAGASGMSQERRQGEVKLAT